MTGTKYITIEQYDCTSDECVSKINHINSAIEDGKRVFLFLFLDGCGPCNATKPEWKNINVNENDVLVAMVNQAVFDKLKHVGEQAMGFPCLRYIVKKGTKYMVEEYENSHIGVKDRSTKSFETWINSTSRTQKGGRSKKTNRLTRFKRNKTHKVIKRRRVTKKRLSSTRKKNRQNK
jgi:hypothetical protein